MFKHHYFLLFLFPTIVSILFIGSSVFFIPVLATKNTLLSQHNDSISWKQKEIIITVWNSSEPSNQAIANMANEKYNLVPVSNLIERLDIVERNKLRAMFRHDLIKPEILDDSTKKNELDNLIKNLRTHKALEAYFVADEPSKKQFNGYRKLFSYLHEKDPSRLAYINLFPIGADDSQLGISRQQIRDSTKKHSKRLQEIAMKNENILVYIDYLKSFIAIVKPNLISYDHYHLYRKEDGKDYFLNLLLVSEVAKESNLPFMNVIQAGQSSEGWRLPTAAEVRFQVYTTLAYGGKGISYFTYWSRAAERGIYSDDGKASSLAKDIALINSEIRRLSPTLMSVESKQVYHTGVLPYGGEKMTRKSLVKVKKGDFVVGLFSDGSNTNMFMIANRNYKNRQKAEVVVDVSGSKLQELDKKSGKWVDKINLLTTRKIEIMLEAGDGRLFKVI
jgi:hypothetical protein